MIDRARYERRRFLVGLVGTTLGLVAGAGVRRVAAHPGAPDGSREVCFWRRVDGPYCANGESREYWCYYCCVGSSCEVLSCETRIIGRC